MKLPSIAGAAPFAHFLGFAKAGRSKAEEDEKDWEARRTEDNTPDEEKCDADDEGDGPKDGQGKKTAAPRAPTEEEDSPDERDDAKGKKAKGRGARSARLRERARCAAIFSDPPPARIPRLPRPSPLRPTCRAARRSRSRRQAACLNPRAASRSTSAWRG